jgi:hypothetical protein
VRNALIGAVLLCVSPPATVAQYAWPPNELSVALGVLRDQSLSQSDLAVAGALSWERTRSMASGSRRPPDGRITGAALQRPGRGDVEGTRKMARG